MDDPCIRLSPRPCRRQVGELYREHDSIPAGAQSAWDCDDDVSTNPLLKDELDEGPAEFVAFGPPPVWSRSHSYHACGEYRRTVALVASVPGDQEE